MKNKLYNVLGKNVDLQKIKNIRDILLNTNEKKRQMV